MPKPHAKDQMMKDHIANWQNSGLTQTAYCRQAGINRDHINYYKKKFAQRDNRSKHHQLVPASIKDKSPITNINKHL
ncbi:MAG: hypothetical protein HQL46_14015 [Gammaproteobacteria bacterium]|nr:hypothetical protein [Gammaproteobacteria bacterium]